MHFREQREKGKKLSKRIRRPLAVLMVSMLLVALSAGAALAITYYCQGGGDRCDGTNSPDYLYDGRGRDYIYAYGGSDYVYANYRDYDYDRAYGGYGNDRIRAYDDYNSGYYDYVYGGPGYDRCWVDYEDFYYGCEVVYER
jgi:RTX calcium-binding nonapeptide repeat (4 copies)